MENLTITTYNCKHFNDSKLPYINFLLKSSDFLLLQEHCLYKCLVPNRWKQTAVFGSKSVHLETGRIRQLAVRARQRRDHDVTVIARTP